MKRKEYFVAGIVVVLAGAALAALLRAPARTEGPGRPATPYREIVRPAGFVNTDGITIGELIGKKVVLLDFVTYSCINCQRTFPYLNAWYDRYGGEGLEVIGIHTPEFAFEKDRANVAAAMRQFGIKFPVVLDNEYATWNAYGNRYWPRKYLIDIHGNVVYDHIGEGAYEETEAKIRELLAERAKALGMDAPTGADYAAASIPRARNDASSPETYFGSLRGDRVKRSFPSGDAAPDVAYLGGDWLVEPEFAEAGPKQATVVYRYRAREVYAVMEADAPVQVEIRQDGSEAASGPLVVHESRLYRLVQNDAAGEHVLELRVHGSGLRIYTFTFG